MHWFSPLVVQHTAIAMQKKEYRVQYLKERSSYLNQRQANNLVIDTCDPPWLFQIYQWMSQISEKHAEVVTQHFLGMTYETRPMYYLKVSEKAENCYWGRGVSPTQSKDICLLFWGSSQKCRHD